MSNVMRATAGRLVRVAGATGFVVVAAAVVAAGFSEPLSLSYVLVLQPLLLLLAGAAFTALVKITAPRARTGRRASQGAGAARWRLAAGRR
ncbi:MAG: hypothetical protein R3357_08580 [Burkholderiales bacterium]|nr:hypothetical protein [Burkholderiales bacterium]